jgi:hypothetical protein
MFSRVVIWLARHSVPKTLTPRVVLPDNEAGRWTIWHLEPALVIDWRDWWLGWYRDAHEGNRSDVDGEYLEVFVYRTLLPCLVLRLHFWRLVER